MNILSQDSQPMDDAETETLTPLHNDSPQYFKTEAVPKKDKVILNQPSVLDELDDDFM